MDLKKLMEAFDDDGEVTIKITKNDDVGDEFDEEDFDEDIDEDEDGEETPFRFVESFFDALFNDDDLDEDLVEELKDAEKSARKACEMCKSVEGEERTKKISELARLSSLFQIGSSELFPIRQSDVDRYNELVAEIAPTHTDPDLTELFWNFADLSTKKAVREVSG